jgi:hypothetical protein
MQFGEGRLSESRRFGAKDSCLAGLAGRVSADESSDAES